MARFLDVLFFIFFLTHIPIALLVDFQAIIPYYPKQLADFKTWYCVTFRDAMMHKPAVWFQSFTACELVVQFPFFFVAAYGYFHGANKCRWLRIPVIVYGTHVATTLIPILAHILFHDFSQDKSIGPRNIQERLRLMGFYTPYFLLPVALVLDALFSTAYTRGSPGRSGGNTKSKKQKQKAN